MRQYYLARAGSNLANDRRYGLAQSSHCVRLLLPRNVLVSPGLGVNKKKKTSVGRVAGHQGGGRDNARAHRARKLLRQGRVSGQRNTQAASIKAESQARGTHRGHINQGRESDQIDGQTRSTNTASWHTSDHIDRQSRSKNRPDPRTEHNIT